MIRHLNTVWLALVAVVLLLLLIFPDVITRESIAGFLAELGPLALAVYILVSLTRAVLLIPATPFVLAGAISFPQWPFLVLAISTLGIVVGAWLVYRFPSFGSYDELLEAKYPDKIEFLKTNMHKPHGFWIIMGWAFFPLVPTDVICYVSGMTRVPFPRMIVALLFGALPLVVVYIFLGAEVGEWLRL